MAVEYALLRSHAVGILERQAVEVSNRLALDSFDGDLRVDTGFFD